MRLTRIKVLAMLLLVPVLVMGGYWIGGNAGWERLWPFILGYVVGAVYAWLQLMDRLKPQR